MHALRMAHKKAKVGAPKDLVEESSVRIIVIVIFACLIVVRFVFRSVQKSCFFYCDISSNFNLFQRASSISMERSGAPATDADSMRALDGDAADPDTSDSSIESVDVEMMPSTSSSGDDGVSNGVGKRLRTVVGVTVH